MPSWVVAIEVCIILASLAGITFMLWLDWMEDEDDE